MPDTKISALTDGTTANSTDRIPVARSPFASGDNRYITPDYIKTLIIGGPSTQLGAADVSSGAVAQTLQVQSNTGAGTTGPNFTIKGSAGTTAGGSIIFQTAATTSYATALSLTPTPDVRAGGSVLSAGFAMYFQASDALANTLTQRKGTWGYLGITLANDTYFAFNSGGSGTDGGNPGNNDVLLRRDDAGILALRNGTVAGGQLFRVYSTYTDNTTNAFGGIGAAKNLNGTSGDVNTLYIGSQKTGSPGNALTKMEIQVNGTTRLEYNASRSNVWYALEINTEYFRAGDFVQASLFYVTATNVTLRSPAAKILTLSDVNQNDFDRLQFGGTNSSYPALKRSSATLQVRLADNSANAALTCGATTSGGTALNVTGTGDASIMSVTNTSTGTLLQVLNSTSNPLMTVTDTTSGTLFSVQSTTAATLFSVNDTTSGTLLDVVNSSSTSLFSVADTPAITLIDAMTIAVGTTTGTKIGTSTLQKIGFWNKAPIAQPTTGIAEATFVENSGGTAVNVDSTFGGYTLQQVVQALQNVGLLA